MFVQARCDCGTTRSVRVDNLRKGLSKSCGCLRRERASQVNTTHGMTDSRLYNIWCGMIQRCTNPHQPGFRNYGGRGIWLCDEWRGSFEAFQEWAVGAGYSDELTIDRIDGRRGYCPENCRFTTRTVQNQNRRKYNNNSTGFRGVSFDRSRQSYVAYASKGGHLVLLGCFSDPVEAARVRDDFVREHYEPPLHLNFPEQGRKA